MPPKGAKAKPKAKGKAKAKGGVPNPVAGAPPPAAGVPPPAAGAAGGYAPPPWLQGALQGMGGGGMGPAQPMGGGMPVPMAPPAQGINLQQLLAQALFQGGGVMGPSPFMQTQWQGLPPPLPGTP